MPRMRNAAKGSEGLKRSAVYILSTVSLLLCIAAVVFWVDSYSTPDRICFTSPANRLCEIGAYNGSFALSVINGWPGPQPLRWCRGRDLPSPGPIYQIYDGRGYPTGLTTTRRFGLEVFSTYQEYALREDGKGYVSDLDGPLATISARSMEDGRIVKYPSRFSGGLLRQSVALGNCRPFAIIFGILPGWLWIVRPGMRITLRILRRRRERFNLCGRCGYDLRATPDRCPECGMMPTRARV